jgi:hypothetical protein
VLAKLARRGEGRETGFESATLCLGSPGVLSAVARARASINASLAVFSVATSALNVGLLALGALSVVLIAATRGRLGYVPAEDLA